MERTARDQLVAIDCFWARQFAFYLYEHRTLGNRLTHMIGIPVILITPVVAFVLSSWAWFVGGQVVGWVFQLVGHRIEGNRPAFLKRPISFLMGPLMVLLEMVGLVGVRPGFARKAREIVEGLAP